MAGEIQGFTGIDDPYEVPERPDLICDTSRESVAESVARVLALLVSTVTSRSAMDRLGQPACH
jgi:adenylylsulfate kinase-like enzyme